MAGHIRSFWDPRMRAALARHVAAGGAGLQPLALAAMRSLLELQGQQGGKVKTVQE